MSRFCNRHRLDVLEITTGTKGMYLADPMQVLGQFYGFDRLSSSLDLDPRSQLQVHIETVVHIILPKNDVPTLPWIPFHIPM